MRLMTKNHAVDERVGIFGLHASWRILVAIAIAVFLGLPVLAALTGWKLAWKSPPRDDAVERSATHAGTTCARRRAPRSVPGPL